MSLAVPIGLAVENARREQESVARATAVTRAQLENQAEVRRQQRLNQLSQTRGTIAAATAGVFSDNFRGTLDRSAIAGARQDVAAIGTDLSGAIARLNSGQQAQLSSIRSSTNATLVNLQGQRSDPFLAGLSGGVSGFSTGLNIRRQL